MKKIFTLAMMMMVMVISANAAQPLVACYQGDARMSYKTAKNEALFLSDKMAYELNLTNAQYEDVYEINLDYLMSVNGRNDAYGKWWKRRNDDLKYVLTVHQYEKYLKLNYFYRPLSWEKGAWTFNVYSHYSNKNHFYKGNPKGYTSYKGGNNKKSDHFYADRNSNKHGNDKKTNGNGSTWRNTNSNNRNLAHNTTSNRNNGSNHAGRH